MAKTGTFPLLIRNQSVVVKIYREKAKSNKDGFGYCVTWVGPNGRERKTVSDLIIAKETAELKASQLAVGLGEGQLLDRSDVMELHEARLISEGVPLLSALREWKAARDLAGPAVLEACSRWAEQRTSTIQRIKIESAVRKFISAKDAVGKQGSATYESKLKPIMVFFPDLYLDTQPPNNGRSI